MPASTRTPNVKEIAVMEGFFALFLVIAGLAVLGLLAARFGADSRPSTLDDWARSSAN